MHHTIITISHIGRVSVGDMQLPPWFILSLKRNELFLDVVCGSLQELSPQSKHYKLIQLYTTYFYVASLSWFLVSVVSTILPLQRKNLCSCFDGCRLSQVGRVGQREWASQKGSIGWVVKNEWVSQAMSSFKETRFVKPDTAQPHMSCQFVFSHRISRLCSQAMWLIVMQLIPGKKSKRFQALLLIFLLWKGTVSRILILTLCCLV